MRNPRILAGNYYHIYNRGVARNPIFFQERNWSYFLERLQVYCLPTLADIVAYCLMPNHYHLLVHAKTDDLGTKLMRPFGISFVKSINVQEHRVGTLFQGKFRAVLVDSQPYLMHVARYIHLNPVAAGLVDAPSEWLYSSYHDYVNPDESTFASPDAVLAQYESPVAYQQRMEDDARAMCRLRDLVSASLTPNLSANAQIVMD